MRKHTMNFEIPIAEGSFVRETEKAYAFRIFGVVEWFPKSLTVYEKETAGGRGSLLMPYWLGRKKGFTRHSGWRTAAYSNLVELSARNSARSLALATFNTDYGIPNRG